MIKVNNALLAAIAVGALLLPVAGHAQTPTQASFTLRSASIDLPPGDRMFPGGAKAEAINNNCLACHSVGMVLNQPALPKAAWDTEVHKMINVYKAPIAEEDVPAIVDYLATTKGAK